MSGVYGASKEGIKKLAPIAPLLFALGFVDCTLGFEPTGVINCPMTITLEANYYRSINEPRYYDKSMKARPEPERIIGVAEAERFAIRIMRQAGKYQVVTDTKGVGVLSIDRLDSSLLIGVTRDIWIDILHERERSQNGHSYRMECDKDKNIQVMLPPKDRQRSQHEEHIPTFPVPVEENKVEPPGEKCEIVVDLYPQCGGQCSNASFPPSHTVMVEKTTEEDCTVRYVCQSLGKKPGECGN